MLTAREAVFTAIARGLTPDEALDPVDWASANLVLPDGPFQGQKWSVDAAPYLGDILRLLGSDSAETLVVVRKSAQIGFTQLGLAWLGYIVDAAPADTIVVFPNIKAVTDFNRTKLHRSISGSPKLRRKVFEQKSRSADGSTTTTKQFPGGSIVLTWSSSSADLRSKTVKYAFCDEVDEWPLDLDGQGDPMAMVDARQKAFHETADYKKFVGSTPTIKGASRIDQLFEAGDRRFWQVPCPHCGEFQRLVFKNLKFEGTYPFNAFYSCVHCGTAIEHHHKRAMVRAGKWVAETPGPGRHPSFHIDALSSLLTTWDKIAEEFTGAKDDRSKLKAFVNLTLGEAWEERGDAPEWQRLFARRGDYAACTIPHGGLVLTMAADVQKDGIYYEVMAWGVGMTNWSIDAGFLPGETADRHSGAWLAFDRVRGRKYRDAYGNDWGIDLAGVDSGFNTDAVYDWVRRHPMTLALKGQPGWYHPPMGTPAKADVTWQGKKKRRGLQVWPVGTWPLKATLYANLRKPGVRDGAEFDPPGYCHFSQAVHDQRYFQQLVAEHIKEREAKGRTVREWVASGENHYHDCRIYNMALAEHLGLSRMTDEDWVRLAEVRSVPANRVQADLFDPLGAAKPSAPDKKPAAPPQPQQSARPQIRDLGNERY